MIFVHFSAKTQNTVKHKNQTKKKDEGCLKVVWQSNYYITADFSKIFLKCAIEKVHFSGLGKKNRIEVNNIFKGNVRNLSKHSAM